LDDDIIRNKDKLRVPSSMTIVVPSWEIVNLLNQPYFLEIRRSRNEMKQKRREQENIPEPETTIEPAVDQSVSSAGRGQVDPPASDENPN
jgi:hypothetical protein